MCTLVIRLGWLATSVSIKLYSWSEWNIQTFVHVRKAYHHSYIMQIVFYSPCTYSLQVMISSKVETLGVAFHLCITNRFWFLLVQKFLRHRKTLYVTVLFAVLTAYILGQNENSNSFTMSFLVILILLIHFAQADHFSSCFCSVFYTPAHCWSWQWKGCCFSWGSPWQHTDWSEVHGCQQVVQWRSHESRNPATGSYICMQ